MAQVQKAEADWQTGLVAPVKDTRVQTEVMNYENDKLLSPRSCF